MIRSYSASYDNKYQKAYQELAKKIAYRYPDPGPPRYAKKTRPGHAKIHLSRLEDPLISYVLPLISYLDKLYLLIT